MAESRPTATSTAKATTSVKAKKSSNAISWLAPIICVIAGYLIWRFIFGNPAGFSRPDPAGGEDTPANHAAIGGGGPCPTERPS